MTDEQKIEIAELIVDLAAAELRLEAAPGMQVKDAAKAVADADHAVKARIRALADEAKVDLRRATAAQADAPRGAAPDA